MIYFILLISFVCWRTALPSVRCAAAKGIFAGIYEIKKAITIKMSLVNFREESINGEQGIVDKDENSLFRPHLDSVPHDSDKV